MASFRFVGTLMTIGERRYQNFGEPVEIADDAVDSTVYMRGGATVVTPAQFASVGFTDDEIRRYRTPGAQINAPAEFLRKVEAVRRFVGVRDTVIAKEAK